MYQTASPRTPAGLIFFVQWVLATVLGWLIGTFLNVKVATAPDATFGVSVDAGEVGIWLVYGAAIGFCQWFVIRKELPDAVWWIVASTAGAALGWVLVKSLSMVEWAGATQGALVGIIQYLVLQNRVRHARWWVLVSAVGWWMGWLWAIMMSSALSTAMAEGINWALPGLAYGIVSGSITGSLLVFLLRRPATGVKAA